ncbi:MAG: prolipoprotein diacylglyceryl transferase [Pirellulaceae bacterium]|nr:prolipoprotein diacylglyceryl transferase [Pirellulaceae bacterium]
MRSTLFYIPHEILGLPLLGFGWLLLALILGCIGWLVLLYRQGRLGAEFMSGLPVWAIAAGIVVFILPVVESRWPDGEPIGLPVRGYGIMVLMGLFAGIGLTIWRGAQVGVSSDLIFSLGFWMMAGGVLGARLFFVVQYWDEFLVYPPGERLIAIVKLTEGGLVIYGGMVGGALAGALFCWRYRLPVMAFADLIAPGFLIGSAFGRMGCLLNGCCFGGICTADLPAISFPQGSPPYVAQLESGRILGVTTGQSHDGQTRDSHIESVEPGSIAAEKWHATPGMPFNLDYRSLPPEPGVDDPARTWAVSAAVTINDRTQVLEPEQLPKWSLPVHPSQIYSAIDSLLLCCLILSLQPWVRHDGQAFFSAVLLHGIARFTLEFIRSDESGKFGTALTISQWISIAGVTLAIVGFLITLRRPAYRAWIWQ